MGTTQNFGQLSNVAISIMDGSTAEEIGGEGGGGNGLKVQVKICTGFPKLG